MNDEQERRDEWGPAGGGFSPPPAAPPSWVRPTPDERVGPTPESWFEPAPAPVAVAAPRRGPSAGVLVVTAALLSAILASSGTYLALSASGALDRGPAPTGSTALGSTSTTSAPLAPVADGTVVAVARSASPAVVTIVTEGGETTALDPFEIPDSGVGSGVIYDPNGWILTNRHVVDGNGTLVVRLADGRRFDGEVYGIDTLTDLAIVKVDGTDLPTARIGDSSSIQVGQVAVAIGSPLGTYTGSVTAGIVSALGRSITVSNGTINNLIQTDTAINPGNSGGPLLDASGAVIGVNTAIAQGGEGIGFAIPINIARPIMEQALAGEKLARPWIGIRYQMITLELQAEENLPVESGAWIAGGRGANGAAQDAIVDGSPAERAGLREGDIIVSVDGTPIDAAHPLDAILTQYAPGRTVTLEVLRDGVTETIELTLGTRPANL